MSEIRTEGDPILREVLPEIEDLSSQEVREAMGDVATTLMNNPDLVGLAANQVGHAVRLFAIKENGTLRVYFNPSIIRHSHLMARDIEGCGSLPGRRFWVERFAGVLARWQQPDGRIRADQLDGERARVYQHELDHLNGILLVDHGEEVVDEAAAAA